MADTKHEVDEAKRTFARDLAIIRESTLHYMIVHADEMLILLVFPSQASRKRPEMWTQTEPSELLLGDHPCDGLIPLNMRAPTKNTVVVF
ncbi:hypothetical protein D3C84_898290 [compost metagenome]